MKQLLWINLYACGTFHRQGKPNTSNIHAGDVYPSLKMAVAAIEQDAGYIDTFHFWAELPGPIYMNPPDSIPTPLAETIKGTAKVLPLYNSDNEWSLETSEADAYNPPLPWERPGKAPGSPAKAFKPTHGGYPTYPPSEALLSPYIASALGYVLPPRLRAQEEFEKHSEETNDAQCS